MVMARLRRAYGSLLVWFGSGAAMVCLRRAYGVDLVGLWSVCGVVMVWLRVC